MRIRQISCLAALSLVLSVGVLLMAVIPLSEAERFPTNLFDIVYYAFLGLSALLGGAMVSLVLMLLNAVYGLIEVVHPGMEASVVAGEDEA